MWSCHFFFLIRVIRVLFSVGIYILTLYTRWSLSPGQRPLLGLKQTITWVSSSLEIMQFYSRGGDQNKCNFLDHIHSCIYRFNCSKMFTLTTTVFRLKIFHIWFVKVKYVLMNLLGLNKLSKLIPMSIQKEFQTVQYREM